MSVVEEQERVKHNALVASFQEKVEHARLLEKNMEKLHMDFADIFIHCEEHQTKYFALDLIKKTYYIIDRAKLLKTGQCLLPYQARTERDFISDIITCSFEEEVRLSGRYPTGLKLSCCSYEGIRFFASDRKSSQRLLLDNARNDLDKMITKFLSALEKTLMLLYNRTFIVKSELFVSVKMREQIKIVAKPKVVLLDSETMKTDYNINIFASTVCLRDDIESLRITPLADCDHYAWLTTRAEQEAEVQEFIEKRKQDFTEQKAMSAVNKALNIGSRIPTNKKQKIGCGVMSTPSNALLDSQLTGGSFKTTCDTGGSSSTTSGGSSFLRNGDESESGSFMDYGSTPIATGAGKPFVSQLDGLDLDEYNQEETYGEQQVRMRKKAKIEKLLLEKQQEKEEFGDFFVEDGEREDVMDHYSPLQLTNSTKKSSVKFVSCDDEEYSETDDYDLKQYQVVKKADKIAQEQHDSERFSATKSKASGNKSKSSAVLQTEAAMNPFGLDVVKFKPVSLRKKTKGEYALNYVQEIEVFVQNKLYSKVVLTDADGNQRDVVVRTSEELQDANKELDVEFITFLVAHTVTIVGSEIALERCIIDYVLKKQKLNGLNQLEQQEISNWKDIFINIENLLMSQVRDENTTKKDLLDAALTNTVNLNETKFRMARNTIVGNGDLSGQEQADAIAAIRKEADIQNAQAKSLAQEMKALLDATLKTTFQKINNAIHYIAMKVCVYWANINNCLDIIEPALVEKYNVRFLKHDTLKRQLASAEQTGHLLMAAAQCEDQPVTVEDMGNALMTEETQLRKIMQNDHAADLMNVIYSVKAKAADIVALVDILWSKTPRTKLSTAVAVKKEDGEKKDKMSIAPVSSDVAGASTNTSSTATVDVVMSVGEAQQLNPLATGSSAAGDGLTQTTLHTNTDGKLGLSLPSKKNDESQNSFLTQLIVSPTPAALKNNVVLTRDQLPRAREAVMCYDSAIKALLTGLSVKNETLCLEIDFKDKRQFRHHRLALLQFLLTHCQTDDLDEAVKAFSETEDVYDLLNCLFYVKVDGVDGSIILGDGYCFYRAVYQLYLRHIGGYVRVAKDMKISDRKCNTKKELGSADHAAFVAFVNQLRSLVKDDKRLVDVSAGELASFKFQRDCELLTVLLNKRPGVGLGTRQWGSQSTVSLLNFNVISLEVLGEKPIGAVEKQLVADDTCSKKSTRWTRFQASSVPDMRSPVSRSKSALSFQDLDMIAAVPFNPLVYTPGHFTTGVTVHTANVCDEQPLFDDFHDLKRKFLVEAFKRVKIMVDVQPGVLDKVVALNSFLCSKMGDSSAAAPITEDDFNSILFIERLHIEFPDSVRMKGDLVDLTAEDESTDTLEIAELKEAVKMEHSKVELLIQHNNLLRDMLRAEVVGTVVI